MRSEQYRVGWVDAANYVDRLGHWEAASALRAHLMISLATRRDPDRHWLSDVDVEALVPEPSHRRTKAIGAMTTFSSREEFLAATREELLLVPQVGATTADLLLVIQDKLQKQDERIDVDHD